MFRMKHFIALQWGYILGHLWKEVNEIWTIVPKQQTKLQNIIAFGWFCSYENLIFQLTAMLHH